MAYRFFTSLVNDFPTLSAEDTFHLVKVLRIRVGEKLELVSENTLYHVRITSVSPLTYEIDSKEVLPSPKTPQVTLLYALPKGDKLELVIQKAVEIGAETVVLVESEHCVTRFSGPKAAAKVARLTKIIKSAAMQSNRNFIPNIVGPLSFNEAVKLPFATKIIAHEKAKVPFKQALVNIVDKESLGILVGPEGGFSEREVANALNSGYTSVTFGQTILRSETAAIYALSIIQHYKEG